MKQYTFKELSALMPSCEAFPTADQLPLGVKYGHDMLEGYIPPSLSVSEGEPTSSQVIIISAPGAVGKSTLAQALSSQSRALIWDLAGAHEVGSGSLDAMLERTFAGGSKADFLEWMSEGLQFVIIDALDEGRIKVNEMSFLRLLENVGELAKGSKGRCFVLLGRTQIAETAWLSLTDQNINTSILAIEPFSRDQANSYIEKRTTAEQITEPFIDCRDLIFDLLEASVTGSTTSVPVIEFLHYPPVLDVISILLDREPNLLALKNFLGSQSPGSSIELLRNVIHRILEREQREKVVPAILSDMETVSGMPLSEYKDSLYTADEQCERLLGSVLKISVNATPDILTDQAISAYNSAVEQALTEHPFLQGVHRFANLVFESYLYARALRGDFGDGLQRLVTTSLSESVSPPTSLLARFYLDAHVYAEGASNNIKSEHLGILYDSLVSSESSRTHVRMSVEGTDPFDSTEFGDDIAEGEFELMPPGPSNESQYEPQIIPFALRIDSDSVIYFTRYMRDVNLIVPCTVELGNVGAEFQIGPAVSVTANRIGIQSDSIVVVDGHKTRLKAGESYDPGVDLVAREFESPPTGVNPIVHSQDFSVSWAGDEVFPWRMYRRDRIQTDFHEEDSLHRVYIRFRRIATALRSHGKGALARTKLKIEHQRVLQGQMGRALLDQLVHDGVFNLRDGGTRYFWVSERASKLLGVSWENLRKGECPETLRQYLSSFIERNPSLF